MGKMHGSRWATPVAGLSNEVVGIPNAELKEPYETQAYGFVVLEGAHSDGSRSARRKVGFETLPMTDKPVVRADDDYYPPSGI